MEGCTKISFGCQLPPKKLGNEYTPLHATLPTIIEKHDMEEDSQQLKLGCNGALTLAILPRLNNWNLTVGTMNPNAILGRTILPISDAVLPKDQRPAVSRREVPVGGVWSQEAALESWRHEEGFGF